MSQSKLALLGLVCLVAAPFAAAQNNSPWPYPTGHVSVGSTTPDSYWPFLINDPTATNAGASIRFTTTATSATIQSAQGTTRYFSTPTSGLEIVTTSNTPISFGTNSSGGALPRMVIGTNGHIGVGTPGTWDSIAMMQIHDPSSTTDAAGSLKLTSAHTGGVVQSAEGTRRYFTWPTSGLEILTTSNTPLSFGVNQTGGGSPSMVISTTGKVGIAMTSEPQYALDVNGAIHATQIIGATYQDVAEWVPATTKMSPGTVVIVQRGSKNTVAPSASAYATSVAGVVSAQPGLILGEGSDSKEMIATTGRVRVHVDATGGAIEAGDLLVTSDKPGVAMKSQPVDLGGVKIHRPGTLIGKALEALPMGEGDILVLLSLQ